MKIKSRRSTGRNVCAGHEQNNVEYDYHSVKRRKNVDNTRLSKTSKSPNRTASNGPVDARSSKKRRTANPSELLPTSVQSSPKSVPSHQLNSCSSASSVISSSGDPIDPYEFAVKADDDHNDYLSTTPHTISNTCGPPMKMVKLDRMEDRSLSDSARSSPLSHTLFNQPSPDCHSSPLAIHCTRPLSVLTDFSSSPSYTFHRAIADVDPVVSKPASQHRTQVGVSTSYPHSLDALITRSIPGVLCSSLSEFPGSRKIGATRSDTPLTAPAVETSNQQCETKHLCLKFGSSSHPGSPLATQTSANESQVNVTCNTSSSVQRCIGVNTTLDTSKSTITEPDLLGPCEPGTTISLNGIVWLETTTGVLVVNVTWRGRTYIGTLLDATQHDFAPPCPRDYVPAFKSSTVRSSNRNKRRTGLTSSYRHHNNAASATPSEFYGKLASTSTNQRHRLRGRTGSPSVTGSSINQNTRISTSDPNELTTTSRLTNSMDDAKQISHETNADERGNVHQVPSDEEPLLDSKQTNNKHGGYSSSSDGPSECMREVIKTETPATSTHSEAVSVSSASCDNPFTVTIKNGDTRSISETTNCEDEELRNCFPIICPIEGCQKRFTNMTALRFHLNHTRHSPIDSVTTRGLPELSADQDGNYSPNRDIESPPNICPSCSQSPIIPTTSLAAYSNDHNDQHEQNGLDVSSKDQPRMPNTMPTNIMCKMDGSDLHIDTVSSATANHFESHRLLNKGSISTSLTSGLLGESMGTLVTTRTVTAHTVSVPCGVTGIPDSNECNGSRPTLAHSSVSRQRFSSGLRSDLLKNRGHSTKTSNHTNKNESGNMGVLRRVSEITKDVTDYYKVQPFAPRPTSCITPTLAGARSENTSDEFPYASQPTLQGSVGGIPVPSNPQLFPLASGMWNFSHPGTSNPISEVSTRMANVYDETGHINEGMQVTGMFSAHSRPTCGIPQPVSNLPTLAPSSSHYNSVSEPGNLTSNSNLINRPPSNQLLDPYSLYRLPEFLVAAAMNAFNSGGMGNSLDTVARSYTLSNCIPGLPKPLQPSPSNLGSNIMNLTSSMKQPNPIATSAAQISTPPLASMFTGPVLPASLAQGIQGLGSTMQGPVPPISSDRLDPFKLSAAYLMQQAAAGSQLPSIFGHQ